MEMVLLLTCIICFAKPVYNFFENFNSIYQIRLNKDKILNWNINYTSYLTVSILFVGLTYVQILLNFPVYKIEERSLIEILGFSIAILGLYGIYIGFLQYLTDHNEGNMFLGKSKVNYLINKEVWYQITQTRFFISILLIMVFVPLLVKLDSAIYNFQAQNNLVNDLTKIWQTSIILLLLIYLFLLKMSLKIIYITLLMKTGSDSGLQFVMKEEIKGTYRKAFWKSYKGSSYRYDLIPDMLKRDFEKLAREEIDAYVIIAFEGIEDDFWKKKLEEFWNEENTEKFSNFYIKYLQIKWEFLSENLEDISYSVWKELISNDLLSINFFQKKLNKRLESGYNRFNSKNIDEYLFDQVLKKKHTNLKNIINDTKISTRKIRLWDESNWSEVERFEYELEKYKWSEIYRAYHELQSSDTLPTFNKKLNKEETETGEIIVTNVDYDNSDIYSAACFEFLDGYYGNLNKDVESTPFLKSIINSMNNEYLVSYVLYQLLYTDGSEWGVNFSFYNTTLTNILNTYNYDEHEYEYYFEFTKKIITNTMLSHRLTDQLFEVIWDTREDEIADMNDWYSNFGKRHRSNPFYLFYIQSLFTKKYSDRYSSRIRIESSKKNSNLEIEESMCLEYFNLLSWDSSLKKADKLKPAIRDLLLIDNFDFSKLFSNLNLVSLLHLEKFIMYEYIFSNNLNFNQTLLEFFKIEDGNEDWVLLRNEMMHFLVLKTIDDSYKNLLSNPGILKSFKSYLKDFMIKNDYDIPDYVEWLYNQLLFEESIKISVIERRMIIEELNKIFYETK